MLRNVILALALVVTGTAVAEEGAEYLVICHANYVDAIQPLVEWRRATGMSVKLVTLSETGSDTASVHNYIVNAWNNWPVKPEYVLLVAHTSQLRAKIYGYGHSAYYTDSYFGDTEGDHKMELAVGRFPASSPSQCDLMVAKTLAYEHHPDLTDPDWPRRLTTIVREDYDPDDQIYWSNVRLLALYAGSAGFVGCDSLSRARGHYYTDVRNSIDAGTGIVMYRGVAGGFWREPFNLNPSTLNNTNMLPVVASITCQTMSLDPYDELLGRQFINAGSVDEPKGAVAFLGNTHSDNDVAAERGAIASGFTHGLFEDNLYHLGHALMRAKAQLYEEFPSAREDYRGFNIFGDPAMPVWTGGPNLLDVTKPLEITPEPQQLEIVVEHEGAPVQGAVVCASMDTTVFVVDTTDATGTVELQVWPSDTGEMRLVVTGQNRHPHDGVIFVVTQIGVEERPAVQNNATTGLTASPTVFSRSATLAWNVSHSGRLALTIRDASGRLIIESPVTAAGTKTWDGRDMRGIPIRNGVYFCALVDSHGRAVATARVTRTR